MITLKTPRFAANISPDHGAILTSLVWQAPSGRSYALLYSPQGAAPTTDAPNFMGLWAMLPFANRAFEGIIDDGRHSFTVPFNDLAKASNIHGFGWQSAWEVAGQDASSLSMRHQRTGTDDPYRYSALLGITLLGDALRVSLSVTNEADMALPYGAGFHPWFNAAPDTRFAMKIRGELAFGARFRATGLITHADGGAYAAGVAVGALDRELAVSAIDWAGEAVLATPSHGLALHIDASPNFRHPVLWAPPQADFVCFEPQSHCIGAPSLAAARAITPLAELQPGETLSGLMTIRPAEI